jgi:glyoxylate reductase
MKKILLGNFIPLEFLHQYKGIYDFTYPSKEKEAFSDKEIKEILHEYDAFICLSSFKFHKDLIDCGSNLKVIGSLAAGYENIDFAYATKRGIYVVNSPIAGSESSAELTIALILAITRGIVSHDKELRLTKRCEVYSFSDRDMMVFGKTLGIIGFGRIGKALAKKAQGLGMKVVYYDAYRSTKQVEKELCVEYLPLDEILKNSDVVSIHMTFLPENYHFMNEERFSLMKNTAYFVNASRGPIVDEFALAKALKEGKIKGAGLDVFEFEPLVTDEIAELDNVVIVPHIGTNTMEIRKNIVTDTLFGITELFSRRKPHNVLNYEACNEVLLNIND